MLKDAFAYFEDMRQKYNAGKFMRYICVDVFIKS